MGLLNWLKSFRKKPEDYRLSFVPEPKREDWPAVPTQPRPLPPRTEPRVHYATPIKRVVYEPLELDTDAIANVVAVAVAVSEVPAAESHSHSTYHHSESGHAQTHVDHSPSSYDGGGGSYYSGDSGSGASVSTGC